MLVPNDSNSLKQAILSPEFTAKYLPSHISVSELLAKGGQGAVFVGTYNERPAAVKVYFPGQIDTRIEREVAALKSINHRTIVKLLGSEAIQIEGESLIVVVTELVPGEALDKRIEKGSLPDSEMGTICYDVAAAIAEMWSNRIVHRDLKPSNIIVRPDGRPCIIDLGVARHLDQTSLTAMGMTWGSIGYLSPEQAKGVRQLSCKSDLFALGVVLIESALGRHPTNRDQNKLLAMGLHEQLPESVQRSEFVSLIQALLHPRPTKRPQPESILEKLSHYSYK